MAALTAAAVAAASCRNSRWRAARRLGRRRRPKSVGRQIFRQAGYSVTPQLIEFGKNPFDGNEETDLVVVCGGDGTVNYIVNSMKRKSLDVTIGIVPAGTANDFAGAIGMSKEPLKAARQIVEGVAERLDCGRVNHIYYINIFSFGLFTTTSQRTSDQSKHKWGKLAYIAEGIKELRRMRGIPLHVLSDDAEFDTTGLITLVFNGETAGGFRLARKASVRDGLLDCVMMRKCNIFATMWAMILYLANGRPNYAIRHLRTAHLSLTSPLSPLTDVDGQQGAEFPITVECIHHGVSVVCPRK